MVTIEDLGILRDVTEDDQGRVHVTITPTYSGCPAMETIRDDLVDALTCAGYQHVDVEFVLSPAWSTDDLTDEGRAKLARAGIAPPGPVGAGPTARWRWRCPCAARSAAASTPASPAGSARPPARVCGSAAPAASPSTTSRPSDVDGHSPLVPPAPGGLRRAVDRRLGRAHLRRARRSSPTTTASSTASTSRSAATTASAAASRSARRRAPACCAIGVKKLPGGAFSEGVVDTLQRRRRARRDDAGRAVHHRSSTRASTKTYVAIAAGSGITPMISIVVDDPRGGAARAGDAGLRQPHPPHGDVPRRPARPQGPLPRPVPAACTCSRASSRTSSCSPAGSTATG